ncbi:hypothetical protein JCM14469_29860 [Desulfatiferula olefinivorans]
MTPGPHFTFFVSDTDHPVNERSALWAHPLPDSRRPGETAGAAVSLGDYFTLARRFLADDDYAVVRAAGSALSGEAVAVSDLSELSVCLVKHGTFYHPSRVDVCLRRGGGWSLALNLAVSPAGLSCIDRECEALSRLARVTDALPEVYGRGRFTTDGGAEAAVFAARWLDDYHEFHLTRNDGVQQVVVWDEQRGHYRLTPQECGRLYRKAARILTSCYNPLTGEQIQPWHHAAGDFVVKGRGEDLDVRLITVRQYTSLFEDMPDDPDAVIEAALIFFINLSIRMRLDREDGIHDTLWAESACLGPVIDGFLDGLASCGPDRAGGFTAFALEIPEGEWLETAEMLIGSYHPDSPDLPVIRANLTDHIRQVRAALDARANGSA